MVAKKAKCETAELDICINQGSTFYLPLMWHEKNEDGTKGDAIDLTGFTARMQIRENVEDAAFIIELTTENGRIELNNPTGAINLTIAAADTEGLDFEFAVYDLELIDGSGVVTRLLEGCVSLKLEVTR